MRQCRIGELDYVAVRGHEARGERARRGERYLLAENRLDRELRAVDRSGRPQPRALLHDSRETTVLRQHLDHAQRTGRVHRAQLHPAGLQQCR